MYIYLLIGVMLLIPPLIIYYLYRSNNYENFKTDDKIEIKHQPNEEFGLDEFSAYHGNNKILETGGKWDLDSKNIYVTIGKDKINIKSHGNAFYFEYKNNVQILGNQIIIDGHKDEIKFENNAFVRGNKTLAEIIKNGDNYELQIKSNEEYLYVYIISFIIFKQLEKHITTSLD